VRRNAVWAIHAIYKAFPHLIPNAAELVAGCLETEGDASCKRNALLMLYHCAQERAVAYVNAVLDQAANFGEILQLALVEIVYKICRAGCPLQDRSRYINCVAQLLGASSPSVRFEAAGTLLALSSAPSSVRNAALCYVELLVSESDNNVKLVVLARLDEVAKRSAAVMQDVVMDVLRGLACPTLDIRRRTLAIALDLVTQKNVADVVGCLKRELSKTGAESGAGEYRQLLVQSVHQCAVRYPTVAADVVHVLMDYIAEPGSSASSSAAAAAASSAFDVIAFVREAVERFPELRRAIVAKLAEALRHVRTSKVFRAALWVLGEYAETAEDIGIVFTALKDALRDIPRVIAEKEEADAAAAAAATAATTAAATTSS
jgi:coatomer subunit beta